MRFKILNNRFQDSFVFTTNNLYFRNGDASLTSLIICVAFIYHLVIHNADYKYFSADIILCVKQGA